jgi:hypothetical protein
VDDNSPENLAGGLAAALRSGKTNQACIRQSAVEYDWASIACKIEREYQALLASKNLIQKATA